MKIGPNTDFFITNMTGFTNTKVTCQNLTIIMKERARSGQIRSPPVLSHTAFQVPVVTSLVFASLWQT